MKKVAFDTLGCKLNFSETSAIKRAFFEEGYQITESNKKADIYVLNTCSVTNSANSRCRKTVRRVLRKNPKAFVAVVGCYAQLKPEEIASIDGVDIVLGTRDKFRLLDLFKEQEFHKQQETIVYNTDVNEVVDFHNAFSSDDRTRAFLKVQDGCNYKCSFCTIPLARGKSRSPDIETIVRQAEFLVEDGYKELVITGVNAGDFGHGTDENFFMLLQTLDKVEGIQRIRISSVEPNLLHNEIIDLVAVSDHIQPHFHIPLQSGSDTMLGLMKRRYKSALYRQRVERIKNKIPEACIGVDVITGHPGETDKLFEESFSFIDSLDISYLHVFTYSERPDTYALTIKPNVQDSIRKERTHKLRRLSRKKRFNFDLCFKGDTRPVLFEGENKEGRMFGYTDNYIRVAIPFESDFVNRIIPVKLKERTTGGYYMAVPQGEIAEQQQVIAELVDV